MNWPHHKTAAGKRVWFWIDNRFYRTEPCIGSKESIDLQRILYSVFRYTSNTNSFEMIGNSLPCCFGKDTTEQQGKRLGLGTKPCLAPKGLLAMGKFDTPSDSHL